MILVTGGTGLVGAHLLLKLTEQGQEVRAIYRREHKIPLVEALFKSRSKNPDLYYKKIRWVKADLNDLPKLNEAFEGVEQVYHCAAFVSFEPNRYKTLRKINIEGTANIVNLSISHKIKKLCYVSSIAAIGSELKPDQLITEKTPWNPEEDNNVYAITKYGAELEVWRGAQEGLDVVVVNPGIIIGGGFWKSGSSGSLFYKINKGMPYYSKGVAGYVGVDDVVSIMEQLMNSPIVNEGFILVSENLSFKSFIDKVCEALEVRKPKKEAKTWLLELGWRADWLIHKLTGKRRQLSKQLARSSRTVTRYDNQKIKKALNYEFEPLDAVISKTAKWFKESNL